MKLRNPLLIAALFLCALPVSCARPVSINPTVAAAECAIATESPQKNVGVTTVEICAHDRVFEYKDEIITPSDFTVAEEIEKRRINAPLSQKIELVDECLQKGADHKAALDVCFPLLTRKVNEVAQFLYVPPVDARVVYKDGKFNVTEERAGVELDEPRIFGALYYSLKFFGGRKAVTAATKTVLPQVTAKELRCGLMLRGEYTTEYLSSTAARAHNVMHAATKLDGYVLKAGETLSFNGIVGERTKENGFETAKIIVDGKYVLGAGGGACQASTAVYNAALLAGLSATANAHSICPSYCPPGLDAMISSFSDLTITNTTDRDVYFSVTGGGKRTTVRVFGVPNEYKIVPESVVNKVIEHDELEEVDTEHKYFDDNATSGDRIIVTPGKDGYESTTYLKYYDKNGAFIKRVKIRTNSYKPTPQITAIAP